MRKREFETVIAAKDREIAALKARISALEAAVPVVPALIRAASKLKAKPKPAPVVAATPEAPKEAKPANPTTLKAPARWPSSTKKS